MFFWTFDFERKIISRFFFGTKKIYKFSKNIEKTQFRRYNFAPGAANHTFFWLTLYINISFLFKIKNVIKYLPHIIFIYTEHFLCILNQKSCLMINNSNLIPWLGIKWNMATIYSIHYIPKFVFLENVCRVLLHPLPIRHVYHLVLQGVDSINEPILKNHLFMSL